MILYCIIKTMHTRSNRKRKYAQILNTCVHKASDEQIRLEEIRLHTQRSQAEAETQKQARDALQVYKLDDDNCARHANRIASFFTRQTLPYGGNGSLRAASLTRILERMRINQQSRLVDLGCGPANVLLFALVRFGIHSALGYEYNADVLALGKSLYSRLSIAQSDERCLLLHADLCHLNAIPNDMTHVFAYDRVMNREALQNIAKLINQLRPSVFASFQNPNKWAQLGLQLTCVDKLPSCITTGNQSFTCYFFT